MGSQLKIQAKQQTQNPVKVASSQQSKTTDTPLFEHALRDLCPEVGSRTASRRLRQTADRTSNIHKSPQFQGLSTSWRTAPSFGGDRPSDPSGSDRAGLPNRLRVGLERLSGLDLSSVGVHYNSTKPARLNALAYAQGTDIYVGPGQTHHLPHEGWHVVQQMQGRVRPAMQTKGAAINDNKKLESEADAMGLKASAIGRSASTELSDSNSAIASSTQAPPILTSAVQLKKNTANRVADLTGIKNKLGQLVAAENWVAAAEQVIRALRKAVNIINDRDYSEAQRKQILTAIDGIAKTYNETPILQAYIRIVDGGTNTGYWFEYAEADEIIKDLPGAVSNKAPHWDSTVGSGVKAAGRYASPLKPGGAKAPHTAANINTSGDKPKPDFSSAGQGANFGLDIVGGLASGARMIKGVRDLSQKGSATEAVTSSAMAEFSLGAINSAKSAASISKQAIDWGSKAGGSAAAAGTAVGVTGVAAGSFVALRNFRKMVKGIGRAERMRRLELSRPMLVGYQNSERAKQKAQGAATKKATITAITTAGAVTGVVGAALILASNPVGWAIAAAGSLVGVAVAAYRIGRWVYKRYKRYKTAESIISDFLGDKKEAQERLKFLGIADLGAIEKGAQKNLIAEALKHEKERIAQKLYEAYRSGDDDAQKVVEAMWQDRTMPEKKLKKEGIWKPDGWKEILRKLKST